MARPHHPESHNRSSVEPTGTLKAPAGFLSWIKKVMKLMRRGERAAAAMAVKRDINRLEHERAKERAALLEERKRYEEMLHKSPEPTPAPLVKPEAAPEPQPEVQKIVEHIEAVSEPIPTTSDIRPSETPRKPIQFAAKLKALFTKSSLAGKLAEERQQEESTLHKSEVEERSWQAYNGVKANLIKDQGVLFFNWQQKILTLALALVLSCLAIGLVYVGLLIWQKERLDNNQSTLANFEAINAEIAKNEREIQDIVTFNRKLDVVSFILTNHVYWTNFFSFLENNTLKSVYYEGLNVDITGKYTIPAVARDLDAISLQLEVMKAYNMTRTIQYSSGQSIAATETEPARVKFNLEMSLDPKLFVK